MNTLPPTSSQSATTLRERTADFFKMEVPRTACSNIPRDHKPLRRTLNSPRGMELWETNEKMCFALWELMSRS
jgi:hypothetical protein